MIFCRNKGHHYDNNEFKQCPYCKKQYVKDARATNNHHQAKRVAGPRCPRWLSKDQIMHVKEHYELAFQLSREYGQQIDVDHIVPLKGKNVSGLHVPWNLQLMAHEANLSKNRKFPYEF